LQVIWIIIFVAWLIAWVGLAVWFSREWDDLLNEKRRIRKDRADLDRKCRRIMREE